MSEEVNLNFVRELKKLFEVALELHRLTDHEDFKFDCVNARYEHVVNGWASAYKLIVLNEIEKRLD